MRTIPFVIAFLILGYHAAAQDDQRYLEDQFYIGLTYNTILEEPPGVNQNSLPYGLRLGFIKDIPLNNTRTFGLGLGLGYGVNSYYSNLRAIETNTGIRYEILGDTDSFKRSKLETHLIEVPLQFRWRNSTATDYKFWRIYGGMVFGYVVGARSKFVGDFKDTFYNPDAENFRYGLALDIGYNTFNIHAYYGLNSLFQEGTQLDDGRNIRFVPLHLGIIFYIL